jgi:hypothetical protein
LSSRLDSDLTDLGLARGTAILGRFESVIDGIPNEVQQRLAEPIENRAIEFEFGADDLDFDTLAQLFGNLASRPWKVVHDPRQGCRAKIEDPTLKFRDATIDAIESVCHVRILRISCDARAKLARTENDLTHGRQESIQGLGSHPNGRIQGRSCRRSGPLRRNGGNRFRRSAHHRLGSGL